MKAWRYGLVVVVLLGLFVWFAHPAVAEGTVCGDDGCAEDKPGSGCTEDCKPGEPGGGGKKEEPPSYPEEPPYAGGNSTCSLIESVPAVEPAL
ncbi:MULTISPECIES: hypothetical protein [Anaerolinea]|uniref:Secreted protein n=1 Tax=Anaerolinea thermophila (strain DSM 14523 / JCM 11388 / NBRC 100420 / UNI-1) TaxID=926569 RepID=E8MZC0_ANATU|nr:MULTISPECIES: hypothetical protein [Anaerolinea]BAJ62263.1 hypothetical protein ANT_02290 [Anaerolinea thermophila UNI-1]